MDAGAWDESQTESNHEQIHDLGVLWVVRISNLVHAIAERYHEEYHEDEAWEHKRGIQVHSDGARASRCRQSRIDSSQVRASFIGNILHWEDRIQVPVFSIITIIAARVVAAAEATSTASASEHIYHFNVVFLSSLFVHSTKKGFRGSRFF